MDLSEEHGRGSIADDDDGGERCGVPEVYGGLGMLMPKRLGATRFGDSGLHRLGVMIVRCFGKR